MLKQAQVVEPVASPGFLERVLSGRAGERHAIIMQDFPDPDAISSGFAQQMIGNRMGISSDLLFEGRISHPQNQALVRLLNIQVVRAEEGAPLESYDACIFVDNQGGTSSLSRRMIAAGVKPLLIVDHHEAQHVVEAQYTDLRDVGSTATIYADYLQQGALELDRTVPEHVALATALMHGLVTDTSNFIHAREPDFQAAMFLSRYYNPEMLEQIVKQSRSRHLMGLIHRALENRQVADGFSISGIGYLSAGERDAIAEAANFLMTEETVHTAIVYGIVARDGGKESIIGSLRTDKSSLSPDQFLKDAFGKGENGSYFGGGRREAGGFEIPLGFLSDVGDADEDLKGLKWLVCDAQVRKKLQRATGGSTKQPKKPGAGGS